MAEKTITLEGTVAALLEEKKFAALRDLLSTMNPADVAAFFELLDESALPLLFRLLPKELAAETFVEMAPVFQQQLIHGFSDTELKEVVDELYVDDAVDLVEEMPSNVVKRILRQADPEMRRMINDILRYPEDSAGSIMTTEFVSLRPQMSVEEAGKRIRRTGVDKETINTCYVTEKGKLIGAISIRTLILSDPEALIRDIMVPNVISVTTTEDQETVAQMFSKYNFLALPVVDAENRLVGIVTIDDAMDVMEEEATEDIQRMAGITPSERPYLYESVWDAWKSRIPWLMILMLASTFTGLILGSFERQLAACLALSFFIPMLTGAGGNSGTQSNAAIVRGIALDEIGFGDLAQVVWKEVRVSVLCGVSLAVVNFVKILLVDNLLLRRGISPMLALTVCLSLVCAVVLAKFFGSFLPLLAKRIGLDPALVAGPLVTTFVDVLSLPIYFGIATALLRL